MALLTDLARRGNQARLRTLRHGHLRLLEQGQEHGFGQTGEDAVRIHIHDARFHEAIALGGAVGAGEAYAAGWWSTDDLTGVVRLMLRNRDVLTGLDRGAARLMRLVRRVGHAWHANTRRGARRNIRAHYDLGNEFFSLLLDETLTYSCAIFESPGTTLAEASTAKYERVCRLLDLRPGDHLVEIGTGWGGFALHADSRHGCRVTTTTISRAQHGLAQRRVREAGLEKQVTVLGEDYRDLRGTYDKLASIEMIEAIGHEQYGIFHQKCRELLAPGGRAVIQAITIAEERYEAARREVDFIKRYIFPGCCIPSRGVLASAAQAAGLHTLRVDEMGLHYAETLRRWRGNLLENRRAILALGFDETFLRLWEFYLCYCEGGFLEGSLGLAQLSYGCDPALRLAVERVRAVPPAPVERAA